MQIGKLTNQQLNEMIFSKLNHKREETNTIPSIGQDCALVDLKDQLMVISTDPITGAEKNIGRLCVNICCNDVAAAGGEPVAMLLTLLIPPDSDTEEVQSIIDDVLKACDNNNIDLIGGHTEVSNAVNRYVLSAVCIGKKSRETRERIEEGYALVMSKTAGLEGTGIIIAEKKELMTLLSTEELADAGSYLDNTSVLREGMIGSQNNVALMHDATEGGILGAAWEMANAAGLGLKIYLDKIPVSQLTKKVCDYYEIDPYRLISSGVMLFAVKDSEKLISDLEKNNIKATEIGHFTSNGKRIIADEQVAELTPPESDELYKVIN